MVTAVPMSAAMRKGTVAHSFFESRKPVITRRKTVDERLEDFIENSKIAERRPLENFRGDRRIEAYRGKGYINKITIKLPTENTPQLELIRNMKPVINKNGKKAMYVDNATVLVADGGRGIVQVFRKAPGTTEQGICVKIFRTYHQSVKRFFDSFADMRKDKYIMGLISKMTNKKLK